MGKPNFSDELKRDAVDQITERGYPVAEVSQRLGISPHSLHALQKSPLSQRDRDDTRQTELIRQAWNDSGPEVLSGLWRSQAAW